MCDTCGDNRFKLIEKYKQKLIDATNIEDSPEEMAVIDDILFRFWQMGWLKGEPSAQPEITYQTCSDALLKMWMDNVLTDGEYNRIMDRLNAWKGNADADHN